MLSNQKLNNLSIEKTLINCALFVGTIIAAFYFFKGGNRILMVSLISLPFALMLLSRMDLAFLFGVIADASEFTLGGINYLYIGTLMQIMVIGSLIIQKAVLGRKEKYFKNKSLYTLPSLFFIALILSLMLARGAGLRILGSETWGGMVYVKLIISLSFLMAISEINISKKQINMIMIGTVIMGIIGSISQRAGFIENLSTLSTIGPESVGSKRLVWLIPFVYAAFPIVLAKKWKIGFFGWLVWLLLMGIMGLTGFRSKLVGLIMATFIFGFILSRFKLRYIIVSTLVGVFLWIFAIVISPHVPRGLQRTLSFIPGAYSDVRTGKDALESVEWRVEIWKYCWEKAPEYFWVGRGSAFNVYDAVGDLRRSDIMEFTPWFAYMTRSYHSGPLTLLIDYGVLGLIIGSWLLILILKITVNGAKKISTYNTIESRFCLALASILIWEIISFYLVYGQMPKFGRIIVAAAVVSVLTNSIVKIYSKKNENQRSKALEI